jgi:CubicO group peptidase (beta-lactamase class C family)
MAAKRARSEAGAGAGFLLAAMLTIAGAPLGASPPPDDTPPGFKEIDRFIAERMAAGHVPGLALAISKGDQLSYVKGYGEARPGEPVTGGTQFFLASISKSFTALAVMQLVETRRIALDAPVREYLPEFAIAGAADGGKITVRQLLHQTSGLADSGFRQGLSVEPESIAERVASLRSARPVALPGMEFHYFNENYAVLARLVETAAEAPFADYLRTHVFEPLGMRRTLSVVTSAEAMAGAGDLAQGHLMAFGLPIARRELNGYLGGSGGVISTAGDMARYLAFQNSDGSVGPVRLLSAEGMELMHRPPRGVATEYAMGWFVRTRGGRTIVEHSGVLSVFHADAALLPQERTGVVFLYNAQSLPSAILTFPDIQAGVLARLTGSAPPAPHAFTITAWGILMAGLTALTVGLGVRGLFRWRDPKALWRLLVHGAWWLFPAVILAAMPPLVLAATGRWFTREKLFRAAPDVTIWLALCAIVGALNLALRVPRLSRARSGGDARPPRPL